MYPKGMLIGYPGWGTMAKVCHNYIGENTILSKAIALKWIQSIPPSVHKWIQLLNQILAY